MRTAVRGYRLSSIDMLRGLAIVVMAIDHVRDYVMLSAEQDPTANASVGAALFFTRWITHFCAPVFVCLAGVSAGLMTSRRSRRDLATFLFARGLWLVFVEMTIVSLAWTFAPLGMHEFGGRIAIPLGVIWAIGVSLIVLAAAQWLGHRACLLLGLPSWRGTTSSIPSGRRRAACSSPAIPGGSRCTRRCPSRSVPFSSSPSIRWCRGLA